MSLCTVDELFFLLIFILILVYVATQRLGRMNLHETNDEIGYDGYSTYFTTRFSRSLLISRKMHAIYLHSSLLELPPYLPVLQ